MFTCLIILKHVWGAFCVPQSSFVFMYGFCLFRFICSLKTYLHDLAWHWSASAMFLQSTYYNKCKPELGCASNASESMPNSSLSCSSFGAITGIDSSVECEWSEHMCPDGYPYYYNCVTSDSRVKHRSILLSILWWKVFGRHFLNMPL